MQQGDHLGSPSESKMMTVSTVVKLVPRPQQRVSNRNTKCVLQTEKPGLSMNSTGAADDQLKLQVADADMPQSLAQIGSNLHMASCSAHCMPGAGVNVERAAPNAVMAVHNSTLPSFRCLFVQYCRARWACSSQLLTAHLSRSLKRCMATCRAAAGTVVSTRSVQPCSASQ